MILELLKDNVEQLEAFDKKLKQIIESPSKEHLWPVFIMILEELHSQKKSEDDIEDIIDRYHIQLVPRKG